MTRKPSPGRPDTKASGGSASPRARKTAPAAPIAAPKRPLIVIEIDPAIAAGYVQNRFDVMLRGRAISAAPIEEIRLQAGDWVTSIGSYGNPERAAVGVMSDGSPAHQRTFQFNLPNPGDRGAGSRDFQIIARTEDDYEYTEAFAIEIDPAADQPAVVRSGPVRPAATYGGFRPFAVMYIERATIDPDGTLSVQGWAVAQGPILAIQISAGDERLAKARIGLTRDDVAAAFPGYQNAHLSGFSLTIPLDEATREAEIVRAQAICANGFGHEESTLVERVRPRELPRRTGAATRSSRDADDMALILPGRTVRQDTAAETEEPHPAALAPVEMYCDSAELTGDGLLSLNGWAVCAAGIAQIRVLLDGQDIGLATYGHKREDVGANFRQIPMAHLSGFRFDSRVGDAFDGGHEVRIVVCGGHGGEIFKDITVLATAASGTRPVAPAAARKTGAFADINPEQAEEFRFELDSPGLANGAMIETVTGRLTIEGWLLTRSGIAGFEVFLDDQRLGDAHYGLARQDVGAAFPDWPNALRSGFAFHCQPRSLRDGTHTVRLQIVSNSGLSLERSFRITVKKADWQDDVVSIRARVPRVEVDMMMASLAGTGTLPHFHFLLRQDGPVDTDRLSTTLDALRRQPYDAWTATVLAGDAAAAAAARAMIAEQAPRLTGRFEFVSPDDAAWSAPIAAKGGSDWFMPLLPGDQPGADALLEFAAAAASNPAQTMIYGDEVRISPVSHEVEPFFKPDFSPDLLASTNYIGRPFAVAAGLLEKTGATPASLAQSGEYDLVLHCAALSAGVHHIPKLLCRRWAPDLDQVGQEATALEQMLARRGIAGAVVPTAIAGTWRVKRTVVSAGKVSIIIPTCAANNHIETCITTLRALTTYPDYEIICIDNIPEALARTKAWVRENADKILDLPLAFNWSVFNNRAVDVADGDYLLFLNDDTEITQDDWLDVLVENAQRPEVGIVGPQLLYGEGTVQHAGMFLSNNGNGRHAFRFAAKDDPCYFGLALTQRNVIAVTGACMMVRRAVFEQLGGFDEAHQIINNDLDFCLKAHQAGLLTVYTPFASLTHYELASRGSMEDVFDLSHFNTAWKTTFALGDPYFNPRLSKQTEDYRPDDEPARWVVSGAPLFHADEIERILVIKLDHIGDFVTALPPIRRLRKIFPKAVITVLAGPGSRDFIALEPSIDEFIPFQFFHARSQLGERDLTREDYAALAATLHPYRFDLAVDLRKHPSTRDVLRYTGARFLAGFDYLGQFPFLDIGLDWDGDRNLQRKRNHIVDDLLGLVNAIEHATENDRLLMQPGPESMPLSELPAEVQALFVRPVVAVHPGAGNITKQWPEQHFSALIDLLIERNQVNILLVGGPDDVLVADSLLNGVLNRRSIASMTGKTSLADLARLLKNCTLYIGNDSGPKHIAAAVGIPTIGIHSGVVDPVEWGPIGPNAVALQRNMVCSPCYLARAEDCPRALACLKFFEPGMVYETANLMLKPVPGAAKQTPPDKPGPKRRSHMKESA